MNNSSFKKRDLASVWHPCTQMKDHEWLPMIPIKRGEGVWLEDYDGNRYLDTISSWWVNLFGHCNPRINEAIKTQLDTLEHCIIAGFTHEPVIRLSEKLVEITPPGLDHCFYADNGSSAVEIALKMSFHYWHNTGETKKTKFINLGNSYHGETLGALSLGDVADRKSTRLNSSHRCISYAVFCLKKKKKKNKQPHNHENKNEDTITRTHNDQENHTF